MCFARFLPSCHRRSHCISTTWSLQGTCHIHDHLEYYCNCKVLLQLLLVTAAPHQPAILAHHGKPTLGVKDNTLRTCIPRQNNNCMVQPQATTAVHLLHIIVSIVTMVWRQTTMVWRQTLCPAARSIYVVRPGTQPWCQNSAQTSPAQPPGM